MNQVNCPVCGNKCIKAGKTKAGSFVRDKEAYF